MSDNQGGSIGNRKKQIISIAVLLALVALTVFAIKQSGQDLNFKMIASTFKHMNYGFLMLALLFMLLFIHIEGRALAVIAKALGYRLRRKQTFVYASADIYFSAITPSATGGQPASAYYMIKDGMKGSEVTLTLVLNILMYTLSLIIMGTWALIWKFEFLLDCSLIFKLLSVIGYLSQLLLLLLCFMCMFARELIRRISLAVFKGLHKIKLIKNIEKWIDSANTFIDKYSASVKIAQRNPLMILKALIMNILHRVAYFGIGYFVYRSLGFDKYGFVDIMAIQLLLAMAVNSLPVPGAVGVAEGNFLSVFKTIYEKTALMVGMVYTRLINYYICFIMCGIITAVYHLRMKSRHKIGKGKIIFQDEQMAARLKMEKQAALAGHSMPSANKVDGNEKIVISMVKESKNTCRMLNEKDQAK